MVHVSRRCTLLALPLLFAAARSLFAADPSAVRQIEIKSYWSGLGPGQKTVLVIQSENGSYHQGRKGIDAALVEALVTAIKEPVIAVPNLPNLGVTPEWVKTNAVSAAIKHAANFTDAAKNQQELYVRAFNDLTLMGKVIPQMFKSVRFDDYPSADISVTFRDGTILSASSRSWHEFMLPWKLSGDQQTFNANISRAVAALMPVKATNRDRLAGLGFDVAVAGAVMRYIEDDWKLLDTQNKAGPALKSIGSTYTVETAEINPYHHPEYGTEWSGNQPHQENLHATLRRLGLPSQVSFALVLLDQDGRIEGVDEFLRSAPKYETLALSLPWLNDFMREHNKVPIRISYVHNASFGERAMQMFAADMHSIGKDALVEEIKARQSDIALLITGMTYAESYWLVMPDKRMVLWRYAGPSGLLKWKPNDFVAGKCSAYAPVSGGCVGAVVSPDGELMK